MSKKEEKIKSFIGRGKYGVCGLTEQNHCVKISRSVNYNIEHEYRVLCELLKLNCVHFPYPISLRTVNVDLQKMEKKNCDPKELFDNEDSIPTEELSCRFVSLFDGKESDRSPPINVLEEKEPITNGESYTIGKRMRTDDETAVAGTWLQVLAAIQIAQKYRFTHCDLHNGNILMEPCDSKIVFLYRYEDCYHDQKFLLVPTLGAYPVIIDYGTASIDYIEGGGIDSINHHYLPMTFSLDTAYLGYRYCFDQINDLCRFVNSAMYVAMKRSPNVEEKFSKMIGKIIRRLSTVPMKKQSMWLALPTNLYEDFREAVHVTDCQDRIGITTSYLVSLLNYSILVRRKTEESENPFIDYSTSINRLAMSEIVEFIESILELTESISRTELSDSVEEEEEDDEVRISSCKKKPSPPENDGEEKRDDELEETDDFTSLIVKSISKAFYQTTVHDSVLIDREEDLTDKVVLKFLKLLCRNKMLPEVAKEIILDHIEFDSVKKLVINLMKFRHFASSFYHRYTETHQSFMKAEITQPQDVIEMILDQMDNYNLFKTDVIYLHDAITRTNHYHLLQNLKQNELDSLNKASPKEKGEKLYRMLIK